MSIFVRRFYLFMGALAVILAVLAVACGDDDDDDDGGDGGGATTVNVLLSEFVVEADPGSASAGDVTFAVTNEGEETHEFVIVKTDLAEDALPTADDGSVDEEGEGVEVKDEIEDIEPGADGEVTANLEAGAYVLLCNIVEEDDGESHYAEGMHTAFTVE
jgi:uncharacterized cupredoxin-like copper-binding protein